MPAEPYIGEIIMFGGNFAPRGWALCNGQLLDISQNTALFSILGTTYGGNGQTTFGLPDLRGRAPIHWGVGPGLTPRSLGEMSGSENVTLVASQMPSHNHTMNAHSGAATDTVPNGNILSEGEIYTNASANAQLAPTAVGLAGGNQPHPNMQPYLCVGFIIALEGIFPPRN